MCQNLSTLFNAPHSPPSTEGADDVSEDVMVAAVAGL